VSDIFVDNLNKTREQYLVYQRKILILSILRFSCVLEKSHVVLFLIFSLFLQKNIPQTNRILEVL